MADLISGFGLLEKFGLIFPFLLIIVLVYAVLGTTKVVGDNKGVHALLALAIAVITLFSTTAREIINIMAPWFVILFIFLIFLLATFKIFGDIDFVSFLGSDNGRTAVYWIITIGVIIFLGSIASVVFSKGIPTGDDVQQLAENSDGGTDVSSRGAGAFWNTLAHPKVLGLAAILLIAMFTVQRLAGFS
ncbi:MAG: hypothetical protein ABII01_04870 [Candidatus Woesearchaeota archaeon]